MKNKNVTHTRGGLHTDNSRVDAPKGTYQYALNAVNETEVGDLFFLSNEESNEPCGQLTKGYVPLGKVYIGDNRTMIFSVKNDESLSEIGIRDAECNYEVLVNGNLGFKLAHQIDATYRLRRGCETTVYWVDGKNNKPMYYVVEKPGQFQDEAGNWDKNKFELQRSYSSIPVFDDIEVQNSGGQLEPGSYNIAVQYLDENLNPTEWITTSEIVKVYNDDTTESFLDIRGSINIEAGADMEDYRNFPTTDKSIRVEMSDLDQTFLFYRLAFIEATTGSGLVNNIYYTENLPIQNNIFIYTGENYATEGTEEEIKAFNSIIGSAEAIEQADNMLLLSNTQGKQTNYCKLQKFASRIKADMTTRKVLTNQMIDKANTKSPTAQREGIGYMPGEIYSFGIVYVFKDGTQSPVYHIPGKSNNIIDTNGNDVSNDFVFEPGNGYQNVYPMSIDNESENSTYNDNSTCENEDYWGVDSMGDSLKFQKVRHHRFPTRRDLNLDLVTLENTIGGTSEYYQVKLTIQGDLLTPCSQDDIDAGECNTLQDTPPYQVRVTFEVNGVQDTLTTNINPFDYAGAHPDVEIELVDLSSFIVSPTINIISIEEGQNDGTSFLVGTDSGSGSGEHGTLNYSAVVQPAEFLAETRIYSTEVFGIQFSGIDLPSVEDTGGEEIIGYYIVRNERTETEKTILDSAVLVPSVTNSKYISHGLLFPEFVGGAQRRISDKVYGLIHPEHKFKNKKYPEFTEMVQEGQFIIEDRKKSKFLYTDVQDGSSYDPSVHKSGGGKDSDGWSLKTITRDNITRFQRAYSEFNFVQDDIEDVFYLDALQSRNIEDDEKTVYNVSADNKVGMVELKEDHDSFIDNKLPYVYLKRPIADSYSTFRTLPYYKVSVNMRKFYTDSGNYDPNSAKTVEFNGDTYVSPMRYVNTMWWDNRLAERAGRTSVWNYIIGGLLVVIGAVLLIFGGSGAVVIGAGIAVIGGGALFISSGIKRDALVRAYYDEYDKGLRQTTLDSWVSYEYQFLPCNRNGTIRSCDTPNDDEIEWIADCVTDLWFESQVNTSLRYRMTSGVPTFIDAPGRIESGHEFPQQAYEHFGVYKQREEGLLPFTQLDRHLAEKLLVFSPNRNSSREYIGHPLGEWYEVNPDYERINSQKTFFHLPLEYDCCSECQEDFPHRTHYSEQSFQEELTDNFRVFLPNNYRDLEGETGAITDLFRIKNNIYIHTEEALWHQPQNFQERVTGDIVSFLGTGGYFSVPPRKILDGDHASGGTRHREATIQNKHGVFFVSENEKKIYKFDGNQLEPISELGNSNWFKENADIQLLDEYYRASRNSYPYDDNPSNPYGVGFISVYDSKKERLIFTKKDSILSDEISNTNDFEICSSNGDLIIFDNFQQTINEYESNGWVYTGLSQDIVGSSVVIEDTGINVLSRFNGNSPFGTLVLNQNNAISNIKIKGKRVGTPNYKIKGEIWSLDANNEPLALLETSTESYVVGSLTTNFQWLQFSFSETNYNENIAVLITPFDVVFSTSANCLITSWDQTGNLLSYPVIRSNDNGTSWDILNDTSLQMELNYAGSSNCKMKFEKTGYNTEIQTGQITTVTTIPPNTIVIPFFDTTSMSAPTIENISATINTWFPIFKQSINGGLNGLTLQNPGTWNRWGTENWVKDVPQLALNAVGPGQDVLLLVFVDESNFSFHGGGLSSPMTNPTTTYQNSASDFVNNIHPQFGNFIAINYPIVRNVSECKEYLQHALAAIEGQNVPVIETDALQQNPFFSTGEWNTLIANLQNNPYASQPRLKDYGWLYKENRVNGVDNNGTVECPVDGISVLTPCQFTKDIENVLVTQTITEVEEIDVEVQVPFTQEAFVEGRIVEEFAKADNSWTMSFSLKGNSWTSWHSYLPNFFYEIADKFYSWAFGKTTERGNNTFWKHNKKGSYQNFYGERHPFSVEYTAMSEPLKTKIWDDITLHTEAKRYDEDRKQYVDVRDVTFNKGIFYNTRQCTGLLNMKVKDTDTPSENYMSQQIVNVDPGTIIIDRNERDWTLNDIRDIRVDYDQPIFDANILSRQDEYYTDKILNDSALDENKSWEQLESLRDKYLVVRLIFDTFDDVKLIMNYSVENETVSLR